MEKQVLWSVLTWFPDPAARVLKKFFRKEMELEINLEIRELDLSKIKKEMETWAQCCLFSSRCFISFRVALLKLFIKCFKIHYFQYYSVTIYLRYRVVDHSVGSKWESYTSLKLSKID